MANKKISQLDPVDVNTLNGSEPFPIEQGGFAVKMTLQQLITIITSNADIYAEIIALAATNLGDLDGTETLPLADTGLGVATKISLIQLQTIFLASIPNKPINYGVGVPPGGGVQGEIYIQTSNGTSGGTLVATWLYDGSGWYAISIVGGGGGAVQTATYAAWDALRVAGTLPISFDIIITDRGEDYMLLKTNHTGDGFRKEGSAGFINCDYGVVGTMQNDVSANPRYSDIFAATGVNPAINRGTWFALLEVQINTGDIVFWNNINYQCIDAGLKNGTDPATNVAAYAGLSRALGATSNLGYFHVWETIEYDFPNDTILSRTNDKATIKAATNIANFPWGDNIQIIMETSSCNLDVRNNISKQQITGRVTGASHNITITENYGTVNFDVSGTGQTISLNKCNGTTELHLIGFSAGVSGNNIASGATVVLYIYNSSTVNIDSLAATAIIKARYYDGSQVNHTAHAGTITWCEFSKGFQGNLILGNGVTWANNKCSYNGYNFTFPSNVSYSNSELGQNDSSFIATIPIDGLTTLDLSSDTYNFCSIFLLTSANATETINTIIGAKVTVERLYPESGLTLTLDVVTVVGAVSGNIIDNNADIVLVGTNRDYAILSLQFDGVVEVTQFKNFT